MSWDLGPSWRNKISSVCLVWEQEFEPEYTMCCSLQLSYLLGFLFIFHFEQTDTLSFPGWPWTHSGVQTCLEVSVFPPQAPELLGFQVCATRSSYYQVLQRQNSYLPWSSRDITYTVWTLTQSPKVGAPVGSIPICGDEHREESVVPKGCFVNAAFHSSSITSCLGGWAMWYTL